MKLPKLPPASGTYAFVEDAEVPTALTSKLIYALGRGLPESTSSSSQYIDDAVCRRYLLYRESTLPGKDGAGTQGFLFRIAAQGVLINNRSVWPTPEMEELRVFCAWPSYLKIMRRRKAASEVDTVGEWGEHVAALLWVDMLDRSSSGRMLRLPTLYPHTPGIMQIGAELVVSSGNGYPGEAT